MTNKFNNIDELFKESARNTSAPEYRSSYWKEMESLLAEENSKKKGFIFSAISGTAAIIGIIAFIVSHKNHDVKYLPNDVNLAFSEVNYNNEVVTPIYMETNSSETNQQRILSNRTSSIQTENQINSTALFIENTAIEPFISEDFQDTHYSSFEDLPVISLTEMPINDFGTILGGLNDNAMFNSDFVSTSRKISSKVDAFAGLGMGQTHNGNGLSRSVSAGVRMHYNFNKIRLTTGLGIQHEASPGVDLQQRSQVYSFGVTNFEHNLIYRSFTDLLVPVEFAFNHNQHAFGLGVQARLLLTTRMSFESKENGSLQQQESLNGRTDGLNTLDADIYAFYSRDLTDKLSLGLRIGHQISGRIGDHNYFSSSSKNNTLHGQVMISYQLGK